MYLLPEVILPFSRRLFFSFRSKNIFSFCYKQFKAIPKTKKTTKPINVKQKTWIGEQIENYKIVDGDWFGEKKHWLNNDYVKFIRFAQWKIDQAGEGVLGFITDNSYLDNITFRGMRQSLLNSFDEIYILDLHGNSTKKDKNTDGGKDENVFDIQQGVSIVFFIKNKKGAKNKTFHQEIWGLREYKYDWLNKHDIKNVKWIKLGPQNPYYFLMVRYSLYRRRNVVRLHRQYRFVASS